LFWIDVKEKEFDDPQILDFGKNIKEVEDNQDKYQDYKKGEKQDKIKEKNDLEVMLINLKSKQRSEDLKVFEVPEELNGQSIGEGWNQLQGKEEKYDDVLNQSIARMKSLEKDLGRFNSLADKIIKWHADKEKFLKEEIKNTDELPLVRAKINIMLSFQNEQKAIKASAEKAFDVGQKVMDGKHSSSNEVQKTIVVEINMN